ncbi:MAG TPA: HEAT repeat domain-containing protein [Pyrinomonadaceae bacterium]|nr:HEAT repeat domain-containing protein [Pyrinomonadaceae bacterium]
MSNGDFAQLFQTAVESEGDEYIAARGAILAMGEAVRPQIAVKLDATDWREQLVAQIVAGWMDHGSLFEQVTAKVRGIPERSLTLKPISKTYAPSQRARALVAMGVDVVPRLLEMLLKSKDHPGLAEMQAIMQALNAFNDSRAVLPLADLAGQDIQEPARTFALGALGKFRDPRTFATVESIFADMENSAGVRSSAAVALGLFADRRATSRLLSALQDPTEDEEVRRYAARGLGYLGDPAASDALAAMLRSEQPPEMALTLVHALSSLGGSTAIAALEETGRSHSDESIRQAAEGARRMLA